jgi:hypothetical protein
LMMDAIILSETSVPTRSKLLRITERDIIKK